MANVKDSEVLLIGRAVGREAVTNRESGEVTAMKVTVMGGDGFSVVKFRDLRVYGATKFDDFGLVAWLVRPRSYSGEFGSGMAVAFIREAGPDDLAALEAAISASVTA